MRGIGKLRVKLNNFYLRNDSRFNLTADVFNDDFLGITNEIYTEKLQDNTDSLHDSIPGWYESRVQECLKKLNAFDQKLINYYFIKGYNQTFIASKFGWTQSAVHWRIKMAVARLRFWINLPPQPAQSIWLKWFPKRVLIFEEYAKDFHQNHTAERLHRRLKKPVSQTAIFRALHKTLKRLEGLSNPDAILMRQWLQYGLQNGPFLVEGTGYRRVGLSVR